MLKYTFTATYTKVGEVRRAPECPIYEFDNAIVKKFLERELRERNIPFDKWEMGPDKVSALQRQLTFTTEE